MIEARAGQFRERPSCPSGRVARNCGSPFWLPKGGTPAGSHWLGQDAEAGRAPAVLRRAQRRAGKLCRVYLAEMPCKTRRKRTPRRSRGVARTPRRVGPQVRASFAKGRLYYFGARWYDPELGLWISPDPAHQFNSPYAYGGDPVNSIDPYGLWEIGLGITVGWTSRGGWSVGAGAALDLSEEIGIGASLTERYNYKSESWTTTVSAAGAIPLPGAIGYGRLGASYDTKAGTTLSAGAGVFSPVGGLEVGGNLYMENFFGDVVGGDLYGKAYYGLPGYNVGVGYGKGFGQAPDRGWYAEGKFGPAQASYDGSWDYGAQYDRNWTIAKGGKSEADKAQLVTGSGAKGHSAITGTYSGEDFSISVGPSDDLSKFLGPSVAGFFHTLKMGIVPQKGNVDNPTHADEVAAGGAQAVSLSGQNIRMLSLYAKMLKSSDQVAWAGAWRNCSWYAAGAMYAAGNHTLVPLSPKILAPQVGY